MRFALLILVAFLTACSKPTDIVFGPQPLDQIAEQGDEFRKLPQADRDLLVHYLMATSSGMADDIVTGKTVGETLTAARQWDDITKARAEEERKKAELAEQLAAELKAKVLAERKAAEDQIAQAVLVAVTDKHISPENMRAGQYSDLLMLSYAVENKSGIAILQLKGTVTFRDATNDEIGSLPVEINTPIKPNATLKTDTGMGWKINKFRRGDIEKIADADFDLIKASFKVESIAFEGGEVLKLPDGT
jgi:hypothetical protein